MNKNLKSLRVKFGLTQKQIAGNLGISVTTYSLKETEKIDFTLTEAKKISDMFGKTIEEVFFDK